MEVLWFCLKKIATQYSIMGHIVKGLVMVSIFFFTFCLCLSAQEPKLNTLFPWWCFVSWIGFACLIKDMTVHCFFLIRELKVRILHKDHLSNLEPSSSWLLSRMLHHLSYATNLWQMFTTVDNQSTAKHATKTWCSS